MAATEWIVIGLVLRARAFGAFGARPACVRCAFASFGARVRRVCWASVRSAVRFSALLRPLDKVLRGELATRFLDDSKHAFHTSFEQQRFQERDRNDGKRVQPGKHSRWARNTQRLGGTPQMWTLLSFTGRFDVAFLEECIAKGGRGQPPRVPGERTDEQTRAVRDAQLARAKLRRGAMLDRLQNRLSRSDRPLNREQKQVLRLYQTGELRKSQRTHNHQRPRPLAER